MGDDRGRAPRRRRRRRRGPALRHLARPARHGHLRLALAGRRRRRHLPGHRQGDRQGPAHRRATSSSAIADDLELDAGTFRVRGTPDQGGAAGRRSPSPPSPPTTCPTAWSPTSRPRSPTTRPTSRGPFGTHLCVVEVDEETGHVDVLTVRGGRRLRQPDQPDDRRRPGARRRHPGPGPGAVRGGHLRRRRQPAHAPRWPTTWCPRRPTSRRSPPATPSRRARPTRSGSRASARPAPSAPAPAVMNAVVDALSHLGVTNVEMPASPLRVWTAIQDAKAGGSGTESVRSGNERDTEVRHDPRRVRLRGRRVGRPRHRAARPARRRRQAHRRRPLAAAAHEAAPGHAVGAHRRRPPRRPRLRPRRRRPHRHRRPHPAPRRWRPVRRCCRRRCRSWPTPPARSATRRCATAAPSAARWPTPTRPRTCRR